MSARRCTARHSSSLRAAAGLPAATATTWRFTESPVDDVGGALADVCPCGAGLRAVGGSVLATTGDPSQVAPSACELQEAQVEACRLVVELLAAEGPRLLLYLGRSVADTLTQTSARLGTSAWRHYGFSE